MFLILISNRIKYSKTSMNNFITYFLSLVVFRNKSYCRRISINGFITHFFESYRNQGQMLMHEHNYLQLYHTCFGSYIDQEHTLLPNLHIFSFKYLFLKNYSCLYYIDYQPFYISWNKKSKKKKKKRWHI